MKKNVFLKITGMTAVQKAVNGREFKTVEFTEVQYFEGIGHILTNKPSRKRNIWNEFTDDQQRVFNADPLFSTGQVGAIVAGEIISYPTTPYFVARPDGSKGPQANKLTTVVFDGEDGVAYTNRQLRRNGACVLDGDTLTAPDNLIVSAAAKPAAAAVAQEEEVILSEEK